MDAGTCVRACQGITLRIRKALCTRRDCYGVHTDLDAREFYEIMRPEVVGISESRVVLTARTGRAGLRDRLSKLGYEISQQEPEQAYQRFLTVADKKQEVFDEDLVAILHDEIHPPEVYQLEYLHIYSGTEAMGEVTMQLEQDGLRVVGRGASTDEQAGQSAEALIPPHNQAG
jgi:hypothetical protein